MTVYTILKMGDPRLLQVAQPVPQAMLGSDELKQLIADMFETMHATGGIGLAAPQIGVNYQLVIFGFEENARYPNAPAVPQTILLNPTITPLSNEEQLGWEGCLSLPGLRGLVPRWEHIRYEGVDPNGVSIVREVSDFHARVVQHECDHLFGKLYPMRMKDMDQFGFVDAFSAEQPVTE